MPAKSPLVTHGSWGLDSPRAAEGAGLCSAGHGDRWHLSPGKGRGAPGRVVMSEENWWALFQCQSCPVRDRCLEKFASLPVMQRRSQIAGALVWNSKGVPTRNYT